MASAVIHLAVAKTLEKNLKIENLKDYYLGSIAPDIAKQIGQTKRLSHFIYNTPDSIPNINLFEKKYPNFKNNSFDLGYFIHLYTDKIWYRDFMPQIINGNYIKFMDGTIKQCQPEELRDIIYKDYTNLNIRLLDEYNMDCSLFYENFQIPKTTITEIPKEKLNILIDKMGIIIENSKNDKPYTFDLYLVEDFIDNVSQKILEYLQNKKS